MHVLSHNHRFTYSVLIIDHLHLDGTGKRMTRGYSMPNSNLYYMIPNQETVDDAIVEIREVEVIEN